MAKLSFDDHSVDIPDAVAAEMKAKVTRFPEYHGNVAEWIMDWCKGTLIGLAQQDHTQAAQAAAAKSQRQIAAMFDKDA